MSDCHKRISGDYPVIRDEEHLIVHDCKRERGGTKTIGIPQFVPVVDNVEPDIVWRDDNYVVIQENDGSVIGLDNV